jgi:ABC-type uncharacterized transport system permease subunit
MLLMFISPLFAKTIQCVKKLDIYHSDGIWKKDIEWRDITPDIQEMLDKGWKVVCMTPVIMAIGNGSATRYVIVIFEREE